MVGITWIDPYLDLVLNEIPIDADTILEVGCGSGILGYIIKQTRQRATLAGLEPFEGYKLDHYDYIFRKTWGDYFKSHMAKGVKENIDVIVSNETIEHMNKKDALDFLRQAKEISDTVIITTPFFWQDQPAYDNNEYQKHKCLMSIDDFTNEGYKVRLIGLGQFPPRPKIIKKIYQKNKDKLKKLGISKTPSLSSRILYPVSMKRFYETLGIKTNNILAIWQK